MHHSIVVKFSKFSLPQAARGIDPLTKILRTFLPGMNYPGRFRFDAVWCDSNVEFVGCSNVDADAFNYVGLFCRLKTHFASSLDETCLGPGLSGVSTTGGRLQPQWERYVSLMTSRM